MNKQIKFIYALLIITIISGGVALWILGQLSNSENNNSVIVVTEKDKDIKDLATAKYAGKYQFGFNSEEDSGGILAVYPKNDKTVLFYLELSRGAPSYNSGMMIQDLIIDKNGKADLILNDDFFNCHLSFVFTPKNVSIKDVDSTDECGFGYGVRATGLYQKIDSSIPLYFTDLDGLTLYFKYYTEKIVDEELAILNAQEDIENKIKSGFLKEQKKEYEYTGPGLSSKTIYIDEKNNISKYIKEEGSEDSSLTYNFYYDKNNQLFYALITGGASNGLDEKDQAISSELKHEIYFTEGHKISEFHDVTGPGYSWSELWPEDQLVFDPQKDYSNE